MLKKLVFTTKTWLTPNLLTYTTNLPLRCKYAILVAQSVERPCLGPKLVQLHWNVLESPPQHMVGKAIFEANIEIRAGLRESLSKKQQCWSRIRSSMVEELTSNKFTATASLEIFLKSRLLQNPESCRTFERVERFRNRTKYISFLSGSKNREMRIWRSMIIEKLLRT